MKNTDNIKTDLREYAVAQLLKENERRNAALVSPYDPVKGIGCWGERCRRVVQGEELLLPKSMIEAVTDASVWRNRHSVDLMRKRFDFEFWAATCSMIKDKTSAINIRFGLNRAQRRVVGELERMRTAGKPMRLIILKARQWGSTTLICQYMSWLQMEHHHNWNSVIVGQQMGTSAMVRGMYSKMLANYPDEMVEGDERPTLKPWQRSSTASVITGRDCLVITGTAQREASLRGFDISMAHLTEVAFWPESRRHSPADLVRTISGSVAMGKDTLVVYESTANGVGGFFHNEWMRAVSGESDKVPIFVPWYEIEIYRKPVSDVAALWNSLNAYERDLWDQGLTLEMINWYHCKSKEYSMPEQMQSEYPTTATEAFALSGRNVFSPKWLEQSRKSCGEPAMVGDVEGAGRDAVVVEQAGGPLQVWRKPEPKAEVGRYVVSVDVGGRSAASDYSVMSVLDRHTESATALPEVVAQWRGHIDHDLLAAKAVALANVYRQALLVIESNSLETKRTEGNGAAFVLATIGRRYGNLYHRPGGRPGYHTNVTTKQAALFNFVRLVREGLYVERSDVAIDEMSTYEWTDGGSYGARGGHHDDIVMSRCIGLDVIRLIDAGLCSPNPGGMSPIDSTNF